MKRLLSLFLAFIITFSLFACQGNFGNVNLNDSIAIPDDGVIQENIIKQIKSENAIGIFTGKSNDFRYEWTIFGSDISETKQINLNVQLTQTTDGNIQVTLSQTENFGFTALLSVYLNERWKTLSATAYTLDKSFATASVTGSKNTILNLTLDGSVSTFEIRPDPLPEDAIIDELPEDSGETNTPSDKTDTPSENKDQPSSQPNNDNTSQPDKNDTPQQEESSPPPQQEENQEQTNQKDQYLTDPVPEGKPSPVEPDEDNINHEKTYTCTFSIECSTILNNLDILDPAKLEMVPSDGVILAKTTVTFHEGESVFDVLQRLCKEKGIHMEAEWTPIYNSAYVEGIHNLYEFDCGALSGWMYKVNGWYPNYGSSRYQLKDGDVVEWRYTCDLGNDVGGGYAVGG